MAANALDRQLTHLEAIRYRFGRNEAGRVVKLLKHLAAARFSDPAALIELTSVNEGAVEITVRPWAATHDYGPVKADLLLCAKVIETNPAAELPAPSTAPMAIEAGRKG